MNSEGRALPLQGGAGRRELRRAFSPGRRGAPRARDGGGGVNCYAAEILKSRLQKRED